MHALVAVLWMMAFFGCIALCILDHFNKQKAVVVVALFCVALGMAGSVLMLADTLNLGVLAHV